MKILLVVVALLSCAHVPSALGDAAFQAKAPKGELIVFRDEVNEDSVETFITALAEADKKEKPILVEIDTPGGSVFAGFAMSRAIEDAKNPVICVVDGMAASMGLYVLQSCDVRVMTHRALLMGHEPSAGSVGQAEDLMQTADILSKLNLVMAAHISYRWNVSVEWYLAAVSHHKELWLTPDQALGLKAIDFKVASVREASLLLQ